MTGTVDPGPAHSAPESRSRAGLRLRLWLGCIGATLVTGVGLWWVLGPHPTEGASFGPGELLLKLSAVLALSLISGIMLAAWLDRGIVARVRSLSRSVVTGHLLEPPGRPWTAAWGELADLAQRLEELLASQRKLAWQADELKASQRQIALVREAVERWTVNERWEAIVSEEGPLRPVVDALNLGFHRQREVLAQNQEAARQVQSDLVACLEEARESAEQAEHGFVEATSMLTSVSELQRLAIELQQALVPPPATVPDQGGQVYESWRVAAAGAIEELVGAASESVEHLAAGFQRVQEIGEQVHLLSNRATLIALNTLLSGGDSEGPGVSRQGLAAELKQLALEVRSATNRVGDLSQALEREIQAATERMSGIRERVAQRLDQAPPMPLVEAPGPSEDLLRLLDRVREMVQDGARKGERVSKAAERASRAAQAVVRRLEDEGRDMDGLVVRLSPTGPEPAGAHGATPASAGVVGDAVRGPANLRLLGREGPGDDARGLGWEERP